MLPPGSPPPNRPVGTSPRTLPKASVAASTLFVACTGHLSPALANESPATAADPDAGGPHGDGLRLIFGGGVGYANHWGRSYEVDAVSGASTPLTHYSHHGVAMNAFADLGLLDLGPGNLGLTTAFTRAAPKTFMNVALVPRYRMRFPLAGSFVRSIEPWAGLGVAFAFREKIDSRFYVWTPLSAGCDLALGFDRLYAGIGIDVNMVNPKGIKHDSGEVDRMDSVVVLVRLAYRVL